MDETKQEIKDLKRDTELSKFIENFEYVHDRKGIFGGQWRILDSEEKHPGGDCEDFALTVSWILARKNIFIWIKKLYSNEIQIWTGHSRAGERHATLKVGDLWIDNIDPFWKLYDSHDMERAYKPCYVLYKLIPEWIWPLAIGIPGSLLIWLA